MGQKKIELSLFNENLKDFIDIARLKVFIDPQEIESSNLSTRDWEFSFVNKIEMSHWSMKVLLVKKIWRVLIGQQETENSHLLTWDWEFPLFNERSRVLIRHGPWDNKFDLSNQEEF